MRYGFLSVFLLILAALASGCSTFHRDWRKAAAQPPPSDNITGPWDGKWISQVNGHNGRLRCLVTELAPGQYEARFHAKYKRVLSFGYTVPLSVSQTNGTFLLRGETKLPAWAGGLYQYDGKATPTHFFSTYHCKWDHGTFEMQRPNRR